MSSKWVNDMVGVGRGLWSVIQKAQTSQVRVHRTPIRPPYARMEEYATREDFEAQSVSNAQTRVKDDFEVKFEEIEKERVLREEEAKTSHMNINAVNVGVEDLAKDPEKSTPTQEIFDQPPHTTSTPNPNTPLSEAPKQPISPVESAKKGESSNSGSKSKGVPNPLLNAENVRKGAEAGSQKEHDDKYEEFLEEVQKDEEKLEYEDTPFYLRQDRPVFTGKETKIPTSPSARALHFGALGISIVGGTISEMFKQNLGLSKPLPEVSGSRSFTKYAMTDSNSMRLSNTLCKMRGAALKIGQILSNTEESFIPKSIQAAFDRARQKADIMPKYQVTEMLEGNLGPQWKDNFREFNLYPLAAASIGQVHEAHLKNGTKVAVKIQYPNIANSIDSDFTNFKRLLRVIGANLDSLYLDELIQNVSEELHEECDYITEAKKQDTYKQMLATDYYKDDYYVPKVYHDLSSKHILTQEYIFGVPIDELIHHSQEVRDRAGELLLKLCIHELFLFKFMQTDPNPANFYYDTETRRINLIDLGAAHHYEDKFVNDYFHVVYGAATNDPDRVIEYSTKLGFLTGEENREMLKAHTKSAMFIGEPFKHEGPFFDFGDSDISKRLMKEIPVMLKNRLSPPPQEVYSLHRKLSGAYFMCIKLRSRVNSRDLFNYASSEFIKANNPDI